MTGLCSIRLLHELLDHRAGRTPLAPAVSRTGRVWSFGELAARSRLAARRLADRGVGRGDRVVLIGRNEPELLPVLFGASRLGAVAVPLADRIRPFHLEHILTDCTPVLVAGNASVAELVGRPDRVAVVQLSELAEPSTMDSLIGPSTQDGPAPCLSVDPVCLIYTSGSTALPKAVVSSHAQVLFAAGAIQQRLAYRPEDVVFCCLPLSFDYGLYQVFLCCLAGAHLVLGDDTDAGPALLNRLVESGTTVAPLVPSLAATLCRLVGRTGRIPARLRMVTNTGADLSPARCAQLRAAVPGLAVVAMFGLTECKRVSIAEPDLDLTRPGSVGRPLPDTEVSIVDDEGRALPPGAVGELVVRGPHVMSGYWNAPELTGRRYRRDALGRVALHTGDRCRLDADGYLYFAGRADDIFKQRGFRVSTTEIEAAALDVPGVELVAALAPDDRYGSRLAVTGEITVARLTKELLARLEEEKLPEHRRVLSELPLGVNGKVDKRALARDWERLPVVDAGSGAR